MLLIRMMKNPMQRFPRQPQKLFRQWDWYASAGFSLGSLGCTAELLLPDRPEVLAQQTILSQQTCYNPSIHNTHVDKTWAAFALVHTARWLCHGALGLVWFSSRSRVCARVTYRIIHSGPSTMQKPYTSKNIHGSPAEEKSESWIHLNTNTDGKSPGMLWTQSGNQTWKQHHLGAAAWLGNRQDGGWGR